jgi:hypothetical protein
VRAIVFSGHMIDAPTRSTPRFAPALEPRVAHAIRTRLDELHASAHDVGISSAACGADILFAEAMLERGAALRVYLPFEEDAFLKSSVAFANADWPQRYRSVLARSHVSIAPRDRGAAATGGNPYEDTNVWMLDEAQRIAGDDMVFVCVWDGEAGDGPGGTRHMMRSVSARGGVVHWIDIRRL